MRVEPLALLALLGTLGCGSSNAGPGAIDGGTTSDSHGADVAPPPADGSTDSALPPDAEGGVPADGSAGSHFPDTNATIAILADQFPSMNAAQTQFAATHYVGTQKQVLSVTQALRAINPAFLVLHYHLAMWQSAPTTQFIIDGQNWGNDYPMVTTHEDWFWHNAGGQRVPSSADGKLLMNVSVAGYQSYWASSLVQQVKDGAYDAIFFDSASPSLLQGECSAIDPRLAGTAAKDTSFPELGNATWIQAWQTWIGALDATLAAQGIPLIPNTGPFITSWDNTNYGLTAGIFSEGFAGTGFAESDWQAATNELLTLAAADKIMILQNYLTQTTDVATRLYYLGNYLLVKGHHAYLDYFAGGPLEWYPEWTIDLGAPTTPQTTNVQSLMSGGVYRRDFQKGSVLVNPSSAPVTVALGGMYQEVVPMGGGAVDSSGAAPGSLMMMPVTQVVVGATAAEIVLK